MKSTTSFDQKELNKLRLVFEQTPGAVFILDKEFRFEFVNPGFEQLSGYAKEELLGKTVKELFYKEEIHVSRREVVEAMIKGEKWQGELLTHNKNGNTYWANTIAAPFKDENGALEGYIMIQQDVTEKKKLQTELQESENLYRSLIENSIEPVSINQDGKFLLVNDAFCDFVGYTREEIFEIVPQNFLHEEDREQVMDLHYKRMLGEIDILRYNARFLHKNGSIILAEIKATTVVVNGRNASFVILNDITERTKIENALRESEEKYRLLFSAESDAIFMIDALTGQILDVNPATTIMYGYTKEELLQMKNTDISAEPEKTSQATKNLETLVKFRLHKRKDGTVFPVELSAGFTKFKDKNIQIVTSRDISERIKSEEAIAKSEQKYRELTEMLPLTVYELDVNNKPTYINKAGRELFGLDSENSGNNAMSFFVTGDRERMKEVLTHEQRHAETVLQPEPSDPAEYAIQKPDGSQIPVLIYGTAIIENGKPIGSRGVIVDISERKTMENALRESEEKYRTLIENATDGIVIVQNGLLKFANQTMCDIMQYNMEELINKPFLDYIAAKEHESLNQFHLRRMQGEQFSNILRSRFIRKDGKMITVELNARTSNYNGAPAGFIVIRDITDRLKIETELQYAKTELEKLNSQLEKRVKESSKRLTEARTQLINLQKENLQSQYDVLKQQVNPHFLFNSLNVLTSLIKLEPDLAEKFSEQLSKVYRYVLENKDNELVDLNTELNFLDAYIFLLNIRFVGKLILNLYIPIENRSDKIIPLAMQLLIENAIKHNVMSKSTPLIIDIFIDSTNCLNVINNLQERPSQIVSTGVGLKNILNRYKLLNLTEPIFEKTDTQFKAKIQLVKN